MSAVHDYATGERLDGVPSARLVVESAKTATGTVTAYLDAGTWHWLDDSRADDYRRMGMTVRTVYVET